MKKYGIGLLIFIGTFLLLGELDFRFFSHEKKLDYDIHPTLLWRLKPQQTGFEWLANMSQKSPLIHINSLGFRGKELDLPPFEGFRILTVGSSNSLGAGVSEEAVWTAQLEQHLRQNGIPNVVYNGATPGWGPFQQAAFLEETFESVHPNLMIVLISSGDLNFLPKTPLEQARFLAKEEKRKKLLSLSPFITYSLRKTEFFISAERKRLASFIEPLFRSSTPIATPQYPITPHIPYWEAMIRLSETTKAPLLFVIPDLEGSLVGPALTQTLDSLTADKPMVRIVRLLPQEDPLQNYLIPNDGHPNEKYHALIASTVLAHLNLAIDQQHLAHTTPFNES